MATHRLETLVKAWRDEAHSVRQRYADDRLATLCETHALELETTLRMARDEPVTLQVASERCGYSVSHLRRLMDSGAITNVGKPGAPRVRLGDLPYRTRRMPATQVAQATTPRQGKRSGVRRITIS